MKKKILFICTANVSRSRTAEDLFKDSEYFDADSAGLVYHTAGKQIVNQKLIDWADIIIAMNETASSNGRAPCAHLSRMRGMGFDLRGKELAIFNIPDIYGRGDPHLIRLIKLRLLSMLGIAV